LQAGALKRVPVFKPLRAARSAAPVRQGLPGEVCFQLLDSGLLLGDQLRGVEDISDGVKPAAGGKEKVGCRGRSWTSDMRTGTSYDTVSLPCD
jgi:hypothetical protein